jgi:hypothetical protein
VSSSYRSRGTEISCPRDGTSSLNMSHFFQVREMNQIPKRICLSVGDKARIRDTGLGAGGVTVPPLGCSNSKRS